MTATIASCEERDKPCWYGSSKTMMSCCMVVQTCSSPRKGQQVTGLHLEKSCVCAPCMWWSNLGWFDLFGCVHTSTKTILAVNQFRNAHVIFPLVSGMVTRPSISCGRLLKGTPRNLGPLYAHQDMSLVCDAFGFAALCSVCKLLSGRSLRPSSRVFTCINLSRTFSVLCRTNWKSGFVSNHHHVIFFWRH